MNQKIYALITERVTALLEKGTIPWRRSWNVHVGMPRNLVSKKPYRGINIFILLASSYESPFWLTFRQAIALGGNVRKGEKACPVIFWKMTEVDRKTGTENETLKIPFLRYYHVFNASQCDNLPETTKEETPPSLREPREIIARMPDPPVIKHGMASPFYLPHDDIVGLPSAERFDQIEEYYAVAFHELVHATGHEKRLNRATLRAYAGFGSDPYCKEELIAEMGAAFLCGQANIIGPTIENLAAYIQAWLARLQSDKTLVVQAATQAQKAADFILDQKEDSQSDQSPQEAPAPVEISR